MFKPHLTMFIDVSGGFLVNTKWKLTQSWLSKCALIFVIGSPVHHLADIFASGCCRCRPVNWASDSGRNISILNIPTCLCFFLIWKKINLILAYNLYQKLFSHHFHGHFWVQKRIQNIYAYFSHVSRPIQKWKPVEMRSQIFGRVAPFVRKVLQRYWTN